MNHRTERGAVALVERTLTPYQATPWSHAMNETGWTGNAAHGYARSHVAAFPCWALPQLRLCLFTVEMMMVDAEKSRVDQAVQ